MITHCDPAELPEAASLDRPQDHMLEAYCPSCNHVVDACCPKCRTHVEPGGAYDMIDDIAESTNHPTKQISAANQSILFSKAYEIANQLINSLTSSDNPKYDQECFSIATGHSYANGRSMKDVAKDFGVTRAKVSKRCVWLCEELNITPSRAMRSEMAKLSYRGANKQPKKNEQSA